MSKPAWDEHRVHELFDAVRDLPPQERGAFLEQMCAGDAALCERVQRLLALDEVVEREGFLSPPPFPDDLPPTSTLNPGPGDLPELPGYEMLGVQGQGGMGIVYKVRQIHLHRVVALKMLLHPAHAQDSELRRFLAEARVVAQLQHGNVVQLFESGHHNGLPYFTMEFVPGGSLADRLRKQPLTAHEAAKMLKEIAAGVQHAHERDILHRDLKPANVLLAEDGTPKVTDFGLARRVEAGSGLTATGAILGTPSYMAPEQACGQAKKIGPAADVYALGAILYECLTGRPPFRAATPLETLLQVRGEDPVPVRALHPTCPLDLGTICHQCLQKDPERRYRSAAELADDLDRFLKWEPVHARPVGTAERAWKWVRRRPAIAALTGTVMLVTLAGAGLVTWKWRDEAHQHWVAVEAAREATAAGARERIAKEEATAKGEQTQQALYRNWVAFAHREWEANHLGNVLDLLEECPTERRGWEWYYLRRLLPGTPLTLWGHTAAVTKVSFSPDGMHLTTESADQTVKFWDSRTGQEQGTLRPPASGVFSPDYTQVASINSDRTITIWNVQKGMPLFTVSGHIHPVSVVRFSPDGTRFASATAGFDAQTRPLPGEVKVWDSQNGKELRFLKGHTAGVSSLGWSLDGKQLASASADRTVRVWDAQTGEQLFLKQHQTSVIAVAFSLDGTRLASTSIEESDTGRKPRKYLPGELKVWDGRTGQEAFSLTTQTAFLIGVAFSPDGTRLAGTSVPFDAQHQLLPGEVKVKVWDSKTGQEMSSFKGHTGMVSSVSWSPDSARLASASADKTVKIWDVRTGQEALTLQSHTAQVTGVTFSPDGARLASASVDKTVKVRDAETAEETLTFQEHGAQVTALGYSPNGSRLASASLDGIVKVWDAETGKNVRTFKGHARSVFAVAFSPDGARIASASADQTVKIWDAETGEERLTIKGGSGAVAFSPDGKRLATGSADRTVKLWDAYTGEELLTLEGTDGVIGISFDRAGTRLASPASDNTVKVWDARTGEKLLTLKGHTAPVRAVAFSPDGKRLASASFDQSVKVWDAGNGLELITLKGHTSAVLWLSWSPDGKRLASSSVDQTVKVWDSRMGPEPLALKGHAARITGVTFSDDGKRLNACDQTGVWTIWEMPSGREMETTRAPQLQQLRAESRDRRFVALADDQIVRLVDTQRSAEQRSVLQILSRDEPGWHAKQAQQAEAVGDWFAAAFHVRRLIALRPKDGELPAWRDRLRQMLERERERLRQGPGKMELVPAAVVRP